MLEVLQPGLLTTAQDGGRPGHAHLGIGHAGAADSLALQLANALVGNTLATCALELTLKGPVLRARQPCWVALAGARLPEARIDEEPLPMGTPRRMAPDSVLTTGAVRGGCRSYLAVAGGLRLPPWLGSQASDVNAGLGPAPLRPGDLVATGDPGLDLRERYPWSVDPCAWQPRDQDTPLRILPSRHTEALDAASSKALTHRDYSVHPDSNRVGCRLHGTVLKLRHSLDIITAGTVDGSIQLPPGGQPIVFGCEHPVSGGYPRIAQLIEADLPRMAQYRPGDRLRFQWTGMEAALAARREQRRSIEDLCATIRQRLEQEP